MPSPHESSTTSSSTFFCTTPHFPSTSARLNLFLIPSSADCLQKFLNIWRFIHLMPSKRKSVTFRENVSMIYPKNFDGSSSPLPITTTPAKLAQPPTLDPIYLNWLRVATKLHYPFIANGTFATHLYRQSFDEHIKIKTFEQLRRAQNREAAVSALAAKYGSLGWGNLFREVNQQAWVKNYRVRTFLSARGSG